MIALHRVPRSTVTRTAQPLLQAGRTLSARLAEWLDRRQQRRALLQLNDQLLKDIGLSRADAWQEARKPFWRL
jgi:uncharacterized protein YjiS (DUF1127 family)